MRQRRRLQGDQEGPGREGERLAADRPCQQRFVRKSLQHEHQQVRALLQRQGLVEARLGLRGTCLQGESRFFFNDFSALGVQTRVLGLLNQ